MTAPKVIQIINVARTRKSIRIKYQQDTSKHTLDERDNPLPAFGQSFDALAQLVPAILGMQAEWASDSLRVVGLKVGEQGGAQTISLQFRKGLTDASKEFVAWTPPRLLAHPTEPGAYTPPLTNDQAALCWTAIECTRDYVIGNRAQGQITFEEDDDLDLPEPGADESAELPLPGNDMGKPAKKKRSRKAKQEEVAA